MDNSTLVDDAQAFDPAESLAARWGVSRALERMTLMDFRSIRKNSLLGFAKVRLPIGLVIGDVLVCTSHGKFWTAMPSKLALAPVGGQIEFILKRVYVPVLSWAD